MFKFLLVISLLSGVQLIEFDRPCRTDVPVRENFQAIFYEGVWYPIERSDQEGPNCLTHHYTRRINQTLSFYHVEEGYFQGERFREEGIATIAFPDETPLRAIFNATVLEPFYEFQYKVVATDYSNYAITWMCTELPEDRSREEISIQSRTHNLNAANNATINFWLSLLEIDREQLRFIEHDMEICSFH